MKRLTEKRDGSYVCINGEFHNVGEHINKLGQLEDIEDELGISLITLFKALKNGIWVKNREDNIIRHLCTKLGYQVCGSLSLGGIAFEDTYYNEYYYSYEDYGKIWALTKEELEK